MAISTTTNPTTNPTANITNTGYTLLDSITKPVVISSSLTSGTLTLGTTVPYYTPLKNGTVSVADVSYMNSTLATSSDYYKCFKLYKNLLCPQGSSFTNDILGSTGAIAINFNRTLLKQGISLNNLSSGSGYNIKVTGTSTVYLMISSVQNTNYTNAYNIYLSTETTPPQITKNSIVYGYAFPTQGIIVLPITPTGATTPYGSITTHNAAATIFTLAASLDKVKVFKRSMVTTYFIRIPHDKFNMSSNPTWNSSSAATNATTFISGIALFNSEKTMVAIAKLDRALIKSNEKEWNLQVKIEF